MSLHGFYCFLGVDQCVSTKNSTKNFTKDSIKDGHIDQKERRHVRRQPCKTHARKKTLIQHQRKTKGRRQQEVCQHILPVEESPCQEEVASGDSKTTILSTKQVRSSETTAECL